MLQIPLSIAYRALISSIHESSSLDCHLIASQMLLVWLSRAF